MEVDRHPCHTVPHLGQGSWRQNLRLDEQSENGAKKASEDDAYEIGLNAEMAAGNYGHINVVMMDDLEKWFEKVDHVDLLAEASIYGFPP